MMEIEELKPHEEVIAEVVEKLARDINRDQIVKDPLIVDQDEHVILDGMHRFNALKRLNCRFAPSCLLDYMSPQVSVGSWFRVFQMERAKTVAEKALVDMNVDYLLKRINRDEENFDPDVIVLTSDKSCFSLRSSMPQLDHCRLAVSIERRLVGDGHQVTYLSEELAVHKVRSNLANLVIILPRFTKDEIRKFGAEGLLLPHKVTRHIIPSRPLDIDVPLSLLMDRKISRDEANDKLEELLAARKINRRPPGSVIDGRRYDEELLVFSG